MKKKVEPFVCFEMLEGMADPIRRVVQQLTKNMLLYCPAATKQEFQNAVAYLTRRLDENTAPKNFLRYAFGMMPGTPQWDIQSEFFNKACLNQEVSSVPNRHQNRWEAPLRTPFDSPFINEADTDWSLPQNRKWAETIMRQWSVKKYDLIPLVVDSHEVYSESDVAVRKNPASPDKDLYRYVIAGEEQLELALQTAMRSFKTWSALSINQRWLLLDEVAHQLKCHRSELIGAMVADTAKIVSEADAEVSEAIDFASYYRKSTEALYFMEDIKWKSKGPVLVASPWNFPCAIPAGGILAALAAGNSVIFKPAPEAVLVGWHLVNVFWKAGISKDVLQFFCCQDDPIGTLLIQDSRIASVILTGATSTAKYFLKTRPDIDLHAETGGKNAIIVTKMADRELAIKDIIQSAFSHSGQKCSACSLAILEKEVYEDLEFRRHLRDATNSLAVGSSWDLSTKINPLISTPNPKLLRALTSLERGEEWLLQPKQDPHNPNLWSPGIKLGVKPGSFTHQTELFGPVLGIMCADNLKDAIEMANSTLYGLTSGIHSLDEREQIEWSKKIHAGNCYINRGITGAIVERQPFGGCKASSFGFGAKAGGPNYTLQFMNAFQKDLPKERAFVEGITVLLTQKNQRSEWNQECWDTWNASLESYTYFWKNYFSRSLSVSKLIGQDNIISYRPHPYLVIRIQVNNESIDILRLIAAALICKAPVEISLTSNHAEELIQGEWLKENHSLAIIEESEEELIGRLKLKAITRMRLLSPPSPKLLQVLSEEGCTTIVAPVLANGRLELLHFLQEISLSNDYHRYGYLGLRENENK